MCVGGGEGSSKLYLNLRTAECGTADQQTSINHTGIFVCVPVVYPGTSTVSLPGTDTVAPTGSASATGTEDKVQVLGKALLWSGAVWPRDNAEQKWRTVRLFLSVVLITRILWPLFLAEFASYPGKMQTQGRGEREKIASSLST